MNYETTINELNDKIKELKIFYSLNLLTEKEYYKIYHRILDKIVTTTEEEQKKCEAEINKL